MSSPEHAVHYLEIVTPDVQAASDFYTNAYGWQFEAEAPEWGNSQVADIDAAVKNAAESGATIALEPMEIPGRGRVAIYSLGGIEQGLWQV